MRFLKAVKNRNVIPSKHTLSGKIFNGLEKNNRFFIHECNNKNN